MTNRQTIWRHGRRLRSMTVPSEENRGRGLPFTCKEKQRKNRCKRWCARGSPPHAQSTSNGGNSENNHPTPTNFAPKSTLAYHETRLFRFFKSNVTVTYQVGRSSTGGKGGRPSTHGIPKCQGWRGIFLRMGRLEGVSCFSRWTAHGGYYPLRCACGNCPCHTINSKVTATI